jgi:hypothetical protein
LWVVVTVLWLAGAGVVLWQVGSELETDKIYLDLTGAVEFVPDSFVPDVPTAKFDREGTPILVGVGEVMPDGRSSIAIVDGRGTEKIFPPGTDPMKAAAVVRQRRNLMRMRVAAILLLPPLVLYGLGCSVAWVYRGFVTSRKNNS